MARLHSTVVLGRCGELLLRASHEEVGVVGYPGVIRGHVVRNEIEDQTQTATLKTLTEPGEGFVSAEVLVNTVVANREAGAADVFVSEVLQDAAVLGEPVGMRSRHASRRLARLPDTKEPDDVEPVGGQPIEFGIRDVVERGVSPQRGREFREPDPRVDLEERWIARPRHGRYFFFSISMSVTTSAP